MNLNLIKPIIFFDLETTGTSLQTDRIIEIGCIKLLPNGDREEKEMKINPKMPIPAAATAVHGITDEMVKDAPFFSQIAVALNQYMYGCDLAGFNSNNFDIPLLIEEFNRCHIEFPSWNCALPDVMRYERELNPGTLEGVYARYFDKPMDGAHNALKDVRATIEIYAEQIKRNAPTIRPEEVDKLCQKDRQRYDFAGKMYVKESKVYWAFGKNMDKLVLNDEGYIIWVLNSDFPSQTKAMLKRLLNK